MYDDKIVGTLALADDRRVAFEYNEAWLENGFAISPFSLPLEKRVFVPSKKYFDGLFGVFADSLPDAWGRLLLDRMLKKAGENPDEISELDRLAIVGDSGMGALEYRPDRKIEVGSDAGNLDELAAQCRKILNTEHADKLDELYRLGGTSGGARPKIMTKFEGEDWIIKFPANVDRDNIGRMEYEYSMCAGKCGINMSETRLFHSDRCDGYFGTKRFDRELQGDTIKKRHMLTVSAVLEISHELPSLDYHTIMKVTKILTRDNSAELERMYRLMCFNVFAHNRDDHAKNFAFLYNDEEQRWELSPAYDLTYSNTYYGEHTTTVDGNGKNPGMDELINVGVAAGLNRRNCRDFASDIKECVREMLSEYVS